jgi:putative oxygen-independent coproporphyrinogen III oxidase
MTAPAPPAATTAPAPPAPAATMARATTAPEAGGPLVDRGLFGVYVHVPFCHTRCHYCDFVTYTGMESLRRPYAAALGTEAELAVAGLRAGGPLPRLSSVFVGGGTPTLLPPSDLAAVLRRLRDLLDHAPSIEITVEANPETVDRPLADGLVAAGVTRVSLGAQSFDDRVLAALGRPHDSRRVGAAVATLREAAAAAGRPLDLNLDLIFGCPGEDAGSWERTLRAAIAMGPGHLSAYALTIEAATKFGRLVAAGRMEEPDEDLLADRYERTCAALGDAGYAHYEVSNWALGPCDPDGMPAHASLHNRTYWRRGAYLGIGAGAHEFEAERAGHGVRRWNLAGVPEYLAEVHAGRRPTAGHEALDGAQARFEALALRLRTVDGLEPAEAAALGVEPEGAGAAELRAAGLLGPGPGLRLTERGMFMHGEVTSRLAP